MIYVPNLKSSDCVVLRDSNTLRVYSSTPRPNSNVFYTDYYINSHYNFNTGYQTFNTITNVTCRDYSELTSSYFYRNDFGDIMIIFTCMLFIILSMFLFLIKTFFRGFRRLW